MQLTPAGLGPHRAEIEHAFSKGIFAAIERMTRRRPLHKTDLPLRLSIAETNGRFRYLILRKDATVAEASAATFSTEAAARAAGGPVLRRRSLAARLTAPKQERA